MVLKILELGILRKLTEKEEESYKGGTSTEGADPLVGGVPKVKDATDKPPISHVNFGTKSLVGLKPPVMSEPFVGSKPPVILQIATT